LTMAPSVVQDARFFTTLDDFMAARRMDKTSLAARVEAIAGTTASSVVGRLLGSGYRDGAPSRRDAADERGSYHATRDGCSGLLGRYARAQADRDEALRLGGGARLERLRASPAPATSISIGPTIATWPNMRSSARRPRR
jgi:hypothetical protein